MAGVEILLWWLPPIVATVVAAAWVSRHARNAEVGRDRGEAAQQRFADAILRELPQQRRTGPTNPPAPPSTGVVIRPQSSARRDPGSATGEDRRSA